MKTSTRSHVTHKTQITADQKPEDGGRKLLIEAFDFIRSEQQVGKLTAQFGPGGSISSLMFEETENIPQKAIEVDPSIQ
ncbi:MAG: hypothetical protein WA213_20805 [Terriglobales bacterium]